MNDEDGETVTSSSAKQAAGENEKVVIDVHHVGNGDKKKIMDALEQIKSEQTNFMSQLNAKLEGVGEHVKNIAHNTKHIDEETTKARGTLHGNYSRLEGKVETILQWMHTFSSEIKTDITALRSDIRIDRTDTRRDIILVLVSIVSIGAMLFIGLKFF